MQSLDHVENDAVEDPSCNSISSSPPTNLPFAFGSSLVSWVSALCLEHFVTFNADLCVLMSCSEVSNSPPDTRQATLVKPQACSRRALARSVDMPVRLSYQCHPRWSVVSRFPAFFFCVSWAFSRPSIFSRSSPPIPPFPRERQSPYHFHRRWAQDRYPRSGSTGWCTGSGTQGNATVPALL